MQQTDLVTSTRKYHVVNYGARLYVGWAALCCIPSRFQVDGIGKEGSTGLEKIVELLEGKQGSDYGVNIGR